MKIKVKHFEKKQAYCACMYCSSSTLSSIVPIKYFYYNKEDQDKQWQECLRYAKYIEDQIEYRQKDD